MRKHIGSTIALVLGVLLFLSGVNGVANNGHAAGLIAGPIIILGAFAYRSAKKRKLGSARNTRLRKVLEALALVFVVAAILLQNDLQTRIVADPFPNIIIPLWVLIAYSFVAKRAT